MAIMIPSTIAPEVKSAAERRIFEWFRSAPGTDDWIVLHSLGIVMHNRVIYGETDFLVLAPGLGVFALEVKGGRIRRENGRWYFTNRYDQTDSRERGPFDQAREGIFSIITAAKERLDAQHQHLAEVFFGYGVMFPDVEYAASGIDEAQWQVFDCRDGKAVRDYVKRISIGARGRWESVYGVFDESRLPSIYDVRYLADMLRGDFECALSVSTQLQNAEDALIRLTKEQYRCLDQIDDNPRCLIRGSAGTGKTLLAMEEVKRSVARGEKVALFCFNSNLSEWMSFYFQNQPQELRPQYIGTFHKYMHNIARVSGLLPDYPRDSEAVQEYYQKALPDAAIMALNRNGIQFDKIVIDEAQDLINDYYLSVMDRSLKKGLKRGRWSMFGDFSMQAIYAGNLTGNDLIEKLEELTSFIRFRLAVNCRNTKQICHEIEMITGFKEVNDPLLQIDGLPVQYITWSDMNDQCSKLQVLLKQLENSHVAPEMITILSPRKREDSVVALMGNLKIRDLHIPQGLHTAFSTVQAYKGLENTVIILTDIEDFSSDKLMYVALSRARAGLYILESDSAKHEYDGLMIRRLLQ